MRASGTLSCLRAVRGTRGGNVTPALLPFAAGNEFREPCRYRICALFMSDLEEHLVRSIFVRETLFRLYLQRLGVLATPVLQSLISVCLESRRNQSHSSIDRPNQRQAERSRTISTEENEGKSLNPP